MLLRATLNVVRLVAEGVTCITIITIIIITVVHPLHLHRLLAAGVEALRLSAIADSTLSIALRFLETPARVANAVVGSLRCKIDDQVPRLKA